jgi:uncharacterized membrane protein YjjP (DUF1212 family)
MWVKRRASDRNGDRMETGLSQQAHACEESIVVNVTWTPQPAEQCCSPTYAVILQLARALHQYGTPAHRLEEAMTNLANGLGVSVQLFSMPTGLLVSFEEENGTQSPYLLRVSNGDLHLEKQSAIDELAGKLVRGEITVEDARWQLALIEQRPERFTPWMVIVAFALSGLAVGRILNGSWLELFVSGVGGLIAGLGVVYLGRAPHTARLAPAAISFAVAWMVAACAWWWGPMAQAACHLAAVIVLVPGLSLTIAMTELSTQHLVSGTARIAGACSVLMQLGFGLALGRLAGQSMFGSFAERVSGPPLPGWTFWLAMLLASGAFLVLFRARPKDGIWLFLAGVIAVLGAKWGVSLMGPRIGPFMGAFLIGLSSNLFARIMKRPSSIMMIPGIIFLVPGSVGLLSIAKMMEQHTLAGMEAAFSMMMIAVSLVFGVLMAALILPPRRSL